MGKRILALLALLTTLGAVAGCNTMEGLGKDIERGGEATQDTARDVKNRM